MAHFDMFVAQIKLLHSKLSEAETLEDFQKLTDDLEELLRLYDLERKGR